MAVFGAHFNLGNPGKTGTGLSEEVQLMGIARDEDDDCLLVTPSPDFVFTVHVSTWSKFCFFSLSTSEVFG